MKKYLVVDGGNISYRIYASMQNSVGTLTNSEGVPTTIIYRMLSFINAFIGENSVDKCIICWDGGSKYRKKVFKHYKANRKLLPPPPWIEAFYEDVDSAVEYFEKLGMIQLKKRGMEADDMVGYMCGKLSSGKERCQITVMSDDRDYYQLLSMKGVIIYRPSPCEFVTREDAEIEIKCPVTKYAKVLALTGQDKDNIPGACDLNENGVMQKYGFGPAAAIKMMKNGDGWHKGIRAAIEAIPDDDKNKQRFVDKLKQVLKSYKLMRIRTKDALYYDWEIKLLDKMYAKTQIDIKIDSGMVSQIKEYLELKTLNLKKILGKLGVKFR